MKTEVLISIGIPFFNAQEFLAYSVLSVLNQSYANWELILLDDGSTDNSLSIARSFNDKRISVLSDGKNLGLVTRLNQLIEVSKGKYIARMDADDIMHPDRLAKQVNFLEENTCIDVVGTSWYSINNKNEIISLKHPPRCPKRKDLITNICFLHPSILGKKEWFISHSYDSNFERIEDYELWLRTISESTFENIQEPLMFYREFGIPHFNKYLKTQLNAFKIFFRYKKYSLPISLTVILLLRQILKIIVFTFFVSIGKVDLIIKRRNKKPCPFDLADANQELMRSINDQF